MIKATLHSDGGARGNPGPAGAGYALRIQGRDSIEVGKYIGETTNNIAEYTALKLGMRHARREGVAELACYLDSELVVKQLSGAYRVKNEGLKPLFEEVKKIACEFDRVTFTHVRREKNKTADRLVNEAIDRKTK